jgi:hypothetical protein
VHASATVPISETIAPLDGALLSKLQSARGTPSVSVLLTTTPGPTLASRDIRRLYRLIAQAAGGLNARCAFESAACLAADLQRMAAGARRGPAATGLALFTNGSLRAVVASPVPIMDRVAIADTFATIDLLRSETHLPRIRVLAISQRAARLYEGWRHSLGEVEADGFPLLWPAGPGRADRSRHLGRDRSRQRAIQTAAHLHRVDAALSSRTSRRRLPLVVAGVGRLLASARTLPTVAPDLIGTIRGGQTGSAGRLARLAHPVVHHHLQETRREALDRLENGHRRVDGIDAVWSAAVDGSLELLCVEERYAFPDPSEPSRHDTDFPMEAVDEAIKLVAGAGGRTVIVDDGSLVPQGGIAALVSARDRRDAAIGTCRRAAPMPPLPPCRHEGGRGGRLAGATEDDGRCHGGLPDPVG